MPHKPAKKSIEFDESAADQFLVFAEAHHDGDETAALRDLLFCHKVLYAQFLRRAVKEEAQHGNNQEAKPDDEGNKKVQ